MNDARQQMEDVLTKYTNEDDGKASLVVEARCQPDG